MTPHHLAITAAVLRMRGMTQQAADLVALRKSLIVLPAQATA